MKHTIFDRQIMLYLLSFTYSILKQSLLTAFCHQIVEKKIVKLQILNTLIKKKKVFQEETKRNRSYN